MTDSDQEIFDVMATVSRRACQWELLLDWTAGSRRGTTVLNDHGKPFRTTGANEDAMASWNPLTSRWALPPE